MFSIMFLGKKLTDTNDLGSSEAQACVELACPYKISSLITVSLLVLEVD
jgi:hypothetical protein